VSKAFDIEKFKQSCSTLWGIVQQKSRYLSHCISRFGGAGISWWFKTHQQQDEFKVALKDLRRELEDDAVQFDLVEKVFSGFIVPEEDLGHVYWYTDAHNKLKSFEKKLDETSVFDAKMLKQAMNELKFIGQSDEFHEIYQLKDVQQKVKIMYQDLQQKIAEQQSIEREKVSLESQRKAADLAAKEAEKAASLAKAKMMESMKVKEKRLAIIEDKKRQQVEKELTEVRMKEQNELAEQQAKTAEIARQEKLQDSYRALEIEETLNNMPLEEVIEMVNNKIENKHILNFVQLDQLSKLKATIEKKEHPE
jgi:hypothetical protein